MKNFCFILLASVFMFGCGKTTPDANPSYLIGRYISDEAGIEEISTMDIDETSVVWKLYNKGKQIGSESFKWSVSNNNLIFTTLSGETDESPFVFNNNTLSLGDVTYRKVPAEPFESIAGKTYLAMDWRASDHKNIWTSYEFKENGDIEIQERLLNASGEIYYTGTGKFEVNGNELKLSIPKTSGESFNEFTAILHADKKSFTYELFDLSIGERRTLFFYASK